MKTIKGGITAAAGFKAAGISSGIKKSGKKDLALIFSGIPAEAAGMFTSNKIKAAPILVSQKQIKAGIAQAIIVNSGNANACNGSRGLKDAEKIIAETAKALGISRKKVLIASTGSIGVPLPVEKIKKGIRILSRNLSKKTGADAAKAILTTDTRPKEIAVELKIKGKAVRIGGIAKGAGMINPNLTFGNHATMLAFISTDANIKSKALTKALSEAVKDSFNMTTVDRERSTNDTVFALANGMSGCREISEGTAEYTKFLEALKYVCIYLAREIARDGEGASKLIEVRVSGAKTAIDARRAAKIIAGSNLLKAAVFGGDPNWGRIMAALGYSGAQLNPDKIDVSIGNIAVVKSGKGVSFNRAGAKKHLKGREVIIKVNLNLGKHKAKAWGCDLSYGYVRINARYHT